MRTAMVLVGLMLPWAALGQVELMCHALADYGLTSAALARQERAGKIARAAADEIMADMYDPSGTTGIALMALMRRVRAEADQSEERPNDFATGLMQRCLRARANADLFLR